MYKFMSKSRVLLISLAVLLILTSVPISAQDVDICEFATEIEDGDVLRGGFSSVTIIELYCFEAEEGDDVTVRVEVTRGDLEPILLVTDEEVDEIFFETRFDDNDQEAEVNFIAPEDGNYIVTVGHGETDSSTVSGRFELSLEIESSDSDEDEDTDSSNDGLQEELNDFDGNWQDAIAELEDVGAISSGGSLIFNEPFAFFDGIGAFFTPLARNSSHRDIVMAATLSFNADGNDLEVCSLLSRVEPASRIIDTFLEIGIDSNGDVFWIDAIGDSFDTDSVSTNIDLNEPHHILYIAQVDELSIYLDGELVVEGYPISERNGSFGIALTASGQDSRCEGSNVWAYSVPVFQEGLCEGMTSGTVNRRSGPGTTFDVAGTLSSSETVEIVGQTDSNDGFIWYELEDESWIREDLISLRGDCSDLPES